MSNIFNLFKTINHTKNKISPIEYLVVGLGNPGRQYENSKHNTGFLTIDYIAETLSVKIDQIKFQSLIADAMISDKHVLLMKPQTFMNLSGRAVIQAASFYKVPVQNIIVIYDDVSLLPGKIRIRKKGSAGGHNGIKSIISLLGSDDFPRIKVGVGSKPSDDWDLADWVLSPFTQKDREQIGLSFKKSYNSLKLIINNDYQSAMTQYNS